eukprot:TRINITY_DN106061_c0_g1_i1.p1 TRINITY_DN106061_c0_g1~~TRINITY_DN106061_c0_g1_i1.p1  ORF type:complete len:766 (-),score=140.21 TRINITY_DN106061_c0_g1_i1:31-2328(-)
MDVAALSDKEAEVQADTAGYAAYELAASTDAKWWTVAFCVVQTAYLIADFVIVCFQGGSALPALMTMVSLFMHSSGLLAVSVLKRSCLFQAWQAFSLAVDGILGALANVATQRYLMMMMPRNSFLRGLGKPPSGVDWTEEGMCCYKEGDGPLVGQTIFMMQVCFFTVAVLQFRYARVASSLSALSFIVVMCTILSGVFSEMQAVQAWARNTSLVSIAVFCALVMKRTTERRQRYLFRELALKERQLVQERVLRCEAEFRSEHGSDACVKPAASGDLCMEMEDRQSSRTAQSATSAISERVFNIPEKKDANDADQCADSEVELEGILKLGQKEHWLVLPGEVSIDRKAKVLGAGSYGVVLQGKAYGSDVAVKLAAVSREDKRAQSSIKEDNVEGRKKRKDAWRKKLLAQVNELRVLRQVRHPNIVLFHGALVDTTRSEIGIIMELLTGHTLTYFMARLNKTKGRTIHCINDSTRFHIMMGIGSALRYLHCRSPQIVHGDLKPDNICIESPEALHPRPKLLDFGLSRVIASSAKPLGGTARWMAPEIITRDPLLPTVSADTFSFACVSFFIVTGDVPFAQLSSGEIVKSRKQRQYLDLHWPQTPLAQHCGRALNTCLAQEVGKRPDMRAVFEELESWTSTGHEEEVPSEMAMLNTPPKTRLLMLFSIMRRCNCPLDNFCCRGHAVLANLQDDMATLLRCDCAFIGQALIDARKTVQCRSCHVLSDPEDHKWQSIEECDLCSDKCYDQLVLLADRASRYARLPTPLAV